MKTNHPVEYLSLRSSNNYANMYPWRLRDPKQCPQVNLTEDSGRSEESLNYDDKPCSECSSNMYSLAGQTNYTKIRINITTMEVISKFDFCVVCHCVSI